eukprot:6801034-Ditylum_brightwellii.AAC.1
MPKNSSKDAATHTALDLIDAIKESTPAAPFMKISDKQRAALTRLVDIFQNSLKEIIPPNITPSPQPPVPHPLYMPRMPTMAPPPMAPPM